MLQRLRGNNTKGFTLIELMIVIAIIGILAAIAIPNFISYRNKSFCSAAESDANSIAGRIANYYAVPSRTSMVTTGNLGGYDIMSNNNTFSVTPDVSGDPSTTIAITVTDSSGRCPTEYKEAMGPSTNPMGYWIEADDQFVKTMRQ